MLLDNIWVGPLRATVRCSPGDPAYDRWIRKIGYHVPSVFGINLLSAFRRQSIPVQCVRNKYVVHCV